VASRVLDQYLLESSIGADIGLWERHMKLFPRMVLGACIGAVIGLGAGLLGFSVTGPAIAAWALFGVAFGVLTA
jgi:hypothetical protein